MDGINEHRNLYEQFQGRFSSLKVITTNGLLNWLNCIHVEVVRQNVTQIKLNTDFHSLVKYFLLMKWEGKYFLRWKTKHRVKIMHKIVFDFSSVLNCTLLKTLYRLVRKTRRGYQGSFPGHWSQVLSTGGTPVPGSSPDHWSQVISGGNPSPGRGVTPLLGYPQSGQDGVPSQPGLGYPPTRQVRMGCPPSQDWGRINRAWLYKNLDDSHRQPNSDLAQLAEHYSDDPEFVRSNPTGRNFWRNWFCSV